MTTNLDRSGGLANSNLQAGSSGGGGDSGGPSTPHTEQRVLRSASNGEEPPPVVGSLWVTGEAVSYGHRQENRATPNTVNSYTEVTNTNWLGVFFSANRPDASANNGKYIYHAGVGSFQRAGFTGFAGFGSYAWSNVGAPSFALPWRGAWDSQAAATEHVQATGDKVIYGSTLYSADDFTAGSAAMDVLSWQPVDEGPARSETTLVRQGSTGITSIVWNRGITTNTDLTFNGAHDVGATTLTMSGSLANVQAGMYIGTGVTVGITPYRIAAVNAASQQITIASPGLTVATTDGDRVVVTPMIGVNSYIQLPPADYERISVVGNWAMTRIQNPPAWLPTNTGYLNGEWNLNTAGGNGEYQVYVANTGEIDFDYTSALASGQVPVGYLYSSNTSQAFYLTYDPSNDRIEMPVIARFASGATLIPLMTDLRITALL